VDVPTSQPDDEAQVAPITLRRCAVVQNQLGGGAAVAALTGQAWTQLAATPRPGSERMPNVEDALLDLGKCSSSPSVLIEHTVWIDNGLAAVHLGTGALTIVGSSFTRSGGAVAHSSQQQPRDGKAGGGPRHPGLFSFGGLLRVRDSQFEGWGEGSIASCRHLAECKVEFERCSVTGST
jgi:hypothetical protein